MVVIFVLEMGTREDDIILRAQDLLEAAPESAGGSAGETGRPPMKPSACSMLLCLFFSRRRWR